LFRYLDEQMFRFNNRKDLDDAGRFDLAVTQIVGKCLTFAELTGKVVPPRSTKPWKKKRGRRAKSWPAFFVPVYSSILPRAFEILRATPLEFS